MTDVATFSTSRGSNLGLGVGLLALAACCLGMPFYINEEQFLETEIRRGGIMKLIEQTVGWPVFTTGMCLFGLWIAVYAIVSIWKAIDSTPDVRANGTGLTFHPAVRQSSAKFEDIDHWSIEIVSGHPVLWIHFHHAYWSLQGLLKRKAIKLEGTVDQIRPLAEFLDRHPVTNAKFRPR